ncbi:hotdog fold thioesterase [Sinomonas sp. JGH33]|uniref:Hotdog fold thioesterase n=1 Tax=Sinomonas terricola TaxID=3110330 RepID=A0ABU5T3W0_9MICC|nr:hotdog fold thioesterase [Sinomonas sp. JGH33]MEA5454342.1 hotdog fold thioesterase [Sinomonas sp. JGH33]
MDGKDTRAGRLAGVPGNYAQELLDANVPERLRDWLSDSGVGALVAKLGIVFEELGPGRSVATMPVAGNTQVVGLLHGGASAALAETLGSFSATLHAGPGRIAVGLDLNVTHHRAVSDGVVRAVCTALQLGRSVASHEIVISDAQGRRVCTARITNLLRDEPGPARTPPAQASR